jgi:hypothetical protein
MDATETTQSGFTAATLLLSDPFEDAEFTDNPADTRGPVARMLDRIRRSRASRKTKPAPYGNAMLRTQRDPADRIEEVQPTMGGWRYVLTDGGQLRAGSMGFAVQHDSDYARELLLRHLRDRGQKRVVVSGGSKRYQRELVRYLQQHGIEARLAHQQPQAVPDHGAAATNGSETPAAVDAEPMTGPDVEDADVATARDRNDQAVLPSPGTPA